MINYRKLVSVINENMEQKIIEQDKKDPGEYDQEGDMAKTQLRTIADAAKELHDMLDDDENMPEWVQNKITKSADYIDSVRDYLKSEKSND
jgi:hypothetical protein